MRKTTIPSPISTYIGAFLKRCPNCFGYGHKGSDIGAMNIRKWTNSTVSLECKVCRFRYSFSWESFKKAVDYQVIINNDPGRTKEEERIIKNWAERAAEWLKIVKS